MAQRITERDLNGVCKTLNKVTGNPETPFTRDEAGKHSANIGNYHIDSAYGGYKLVQMVNTGGGIRTITSGYITKRELYYQIHSYMDGILEGMEATKIA